MSLTGANTIITISVPPLFIAPVQIQGFAADDVFDVNPITSVETMMGVDGQLSAGFVFVAVVQNIALQADSPSIIVFDTWWASMQAAQDVYTAAAQVVLPGVSKKYNMTQGYLSGYKPLPDAKRLYQPQRFQITWGRISPAPF